MMPPAELGEHLGIPTQTIYQASPRRNMYGVFADAPIGLDPDDLRQVRRRMWTDLGTDPEA